MSNKERFIKIVLIAIVVIFIGWSYFIFSKKDEKYIGNICVEDNIVFKETGGDCKNSIKKAVIFTKDDWEKYLDENKEILIANFGLEENREWRCSDEERESNYHKTKNKEECIKKYSPSDFLRTIEQPLIFGNKVYFIGSGMIGFEWSEVFAVGVYNIDSNSFSVANDMFFSGFGELMYVKTNKGNYIAIFSRESGSGAGLITDFYVLDADNNKKLFGTDDLLQIGKYDQELSKEISTIVRQSLGDMNVILTLPETNENGCGSSEIEYLDRFNSSTEYLIKWFFSPYVEMAYPIKTDFFLRKIVGWDDEKDNAIYDNFLLEQNIDTHIANNQHVTSFPKRFSDSNGRYYLVARFNHPIEEYSLSGSYGVDPNDKGKFIEFESPMFCIK